MARTSTKVALITGGSSGIGRAAAVAFAKTGARVVVAARRRAEGEETLRLVEAAGSEGIFVPADVRRAAEVRAMVEACVETYGGLDYAFNNAGIEGSAFVKTADYDEETFREVIDVNLTGVFLSMKYEIPALLARGGGAIVNMSSVAGLIGGVVGAAYHASKHGVIGLTKSLARDLASANIRVNAICPGLIRTPLTESYFTDERFEKELATLVPQRRYGESGDVAQAALYLASEMSSYVNGVALPVDGGWLAEKSFVIGEASSAFYSGHETAG